MSATIPESHKDLLERPIVVSLATLLPDGQPQVNCVWCSYDGSHLWMFTIRGFQKEKNLHQRRLATILVMDPDDPYRYLEVRGEVEEMTEDGAEALADRLTQKYMGAPTYFGYVSPPESRDRITLVACKIRPTRVVTVG